MKTRPLTVVGTFIVAFAVSWLGADQFAERSNQRRDDETVSLQSTREVFRELSEIRGLDGLARIRDFLEDDFLTFHLDRAGVGGGVSPDILVAAIRNLEPVLTGSLRRDGLRKDRLDRIPNSLGAALWAIDRLALQSRSATFLLPPTLRSEALQLKRDLVAPLGRPPALDESVWVDIRAGSFMMGSADGERHVHSQRTAKIDRDQRPAHRRSVGDFRVSKCEFSEDWVVEDREQAEGTPSLDCTGRPLRTNWYRSYVLAVWIGGPSARLPSEAEWEYLARRGAPGDLLREVPWTTAASHDDWCDRAVVSGCSDDDRPRPVCSLGPAGLSPQGLCDLAGNAAEWVNDWYDPYGFYRSGSTGYPSWGSSTPFEEALRVVRGGHAASRPEEVFGMVREGRHPATGDVQVGFRIAAGKTRCCSYGGGM